MSQIKQIITKYSFAVCLISPLVSATPAITGVNGTASLDNTITISGAGFGTRAQNTPFYYSNFEQDRIGDSAYAAGLDNLGNDKKGLPYIRNDKALSGSKSLRMDYLLDQNAMFPRIGKSGLKSIEVYVSVWTYWIRKKGTGDTSPIFKLVRGGANPPYSGVPKFYETVRPDASGHIGAVDRGSTDTNRTTTRAKDVNAGQDAGGWHRSEYYYKLSKPGVANGIYQTWVDGTMNADLDNILIRKAGDNSLINYVMSPFDGMDRIGRTDAYSVWMDNFYIATTRARVEIGDAPTLAKCKTRYIQPSVRWSSNSIAVKVKPNKFTTGQKVYLYVFNNNGQYNANGYPVTIGSTGAALPKSPVLSAQPQ